MSSPFPNLIVIIRHAEKPSEPGDPDLSPDGVRRAAMLAQRLPALYPALSDLFATARSADSNRPVETIQPLADLVHLPINTNFADHDHKQLAKFLIDGEAFAGRTVLICWHHEKIPALALDLGTTNAPDSWPGDVFDDIWEITYAPDGTASFASKKQPPVQP